MALARPLAVLLCLAAAPAAAQTWTTQTQAGVTIAGTLVDGALAGLRLECGPDGRIRTSLSHNGRRFDRSREHTVVLSVDGLATLLAMRAQDSARRGDDDLTRDDPAAAMLPLIEALSAGRTLEVSAPSGRYRLRLAGSSRALATLRAACGL